MAVINGIVTLGEAETPGEAALLLFNEACDTILDTTTSSAVDGSYEFTGLASETVFYIVALGGGEYRSRCFGPITTGT